MAPHELKRTLDLVDPATDKSAAAITTAQTTGDTMVTRLPTYAAEDGAPKSATATNPVLAPYLDDALQDAERLMKYAAEVGMDVDDDIRNNILQARTHGSVLSNKQTANLLTALTKLAARLRPVTAESLKACTVDERRTVYGYLKLAICLAAIIVPFSIAGFVTSLVSDEISKDMVTGNELAAKLTAQLRLEQAPATAVAAASAAQPAVGLPATPTEAEILAELQQFASIIRHVDNRAKTLNAFVFPREQDPYATIRIDPMALHDVFQLPVLPPGAPKAVAEAAEVRIRVYQDVRYFAERLLDYVSYFYGAIANCVLPVLYALLGTCAYLLRSFEQQTRNKTFVPSIADFARFLIAGIGGAVVGLFSNFTLRQGASIPPLAIAFLIGYSVDVFFSFLDGLLLAFTKTKSGGNSGS
jgi:hypothetical protein